MFDIYKQWQTKSIKEGVMWSYVWNTHALPYVKGYRNECDSADIKRIVNMVNCFALKHTSDLINLIMVYLLPLQLLGLQSTEFQD
jgi:hypothetical protein